MGRKVTVECRLKKEDSSSQPEIVKGKLERNFEEIALGNLS